LIQPRLQYCIPSFAQATALKKAARLCFAELDPRFGTLSQAYRYDNSHYRKGDVICEIRKRSDTLRGAINPHERRIVFTEFKAKVDEN